ncbi:MAG: GTPase HflX [Chloroflexi bacterium]|nr:GTPase HflX [Chloroflexota bacterium]
MVREDAIGKGRFPTRAPVERAILAGVEVRGHRNAFTLDDSLEELAQLATTAGAEVVGGVSQRVVRPQRSYLGKGKLEELADLADRHQASVVMLNDELTPAQQRIVEDAVQVKVIDRTALILDIFAGRALTKEGRLQVELAQHEYLLPRLAGQWSHLERLGGGIGTRGPGETQIETDRRLVRGRIQHIERELEKVMRRRAQYTERRKKSTVPIASLVGYTNAGKSTLFNALSSGGVLVQDQLFSTLDPVTRRVRLPSGAPLLLTDTVGFIQKLSPTVVAAFRATLEELSQSDILLHVVDITHPKAAEQAQVVEDILDDLGLAEKPRVLVANKMDLIKDDAGAPSIPDLDPGRSVKISAAKGWNLDQLLQRIETTLMNVDGPLTFVSTTTGS